MGCCLSKKPCSKSVINCSNNDNVSKPEQIDLQIATPKRNNSVKAQIELPRLAKDEDIKELSVSKAKKEKKEVFVIHHRKSNDKGPHLDGSGSNLSDPESLGRNLMAAVASGQVVRTSSCTKEEVDAILIQCGRLSRSSSGNGVGKKYSGSKRSFDFDREGEGNGNGNGEEGEGEGEEGRLRRRESRGSERRTPRGSRERGVEQRSGSREKRRVSRSPGRRSQSPICRNGNESVGSVGSGNVSGGSKPGKLVSVPATVTSLSIDKGSNGNVGDIGNVKRVLVKRNVGSPRSQSPARGNQVNGNLNGRSESPARVNQVNGNGRSQSPAKGNAVNGNGGGQQMASLSRNGSRKADQSPYRSTPLNEIDLNSLPFQPLATKRPLNKGKEMEEDGLVVKQPINPLSQNKYATDIVGGKAQGTHRRTTSRGAEEYEFTKTNYSRVNDLHTPNSDKNNHEKDQLNSVGYDAMLTPVMLSNTDTLKLPQTSVRRSSRRSRDLDTDVDALLTPTPAINYTSLLLQDIQKFHKNKNLSVNSGPNPNTKLNNTITLPPCVSKARSIVEAVADLNSTWVNPSGNFSFNSVKKRVDPFVESEVKAVDDLLEPSFHKYVTVRKRGGDIDDEESSGSNSIVGNGGQQNRVFSSSSWEPNSGDSTDCWTSNSCTREDEFSPIGFPKHVISDIECGNVEEWSVKYSRNGREQIGAAGNPLKLQK